MTKETPIEKSLSADQVKLLREMTGKSQESAANDLHQKDGAFWRKFENGTRVIPSYYVELFCLKNCNGQVKPDTILGSLSIKHTLKFQRRLIT